VKDKFNNEYKKRYADSVVPRTYSQDDWARISFCYNSLVEWGGSVLDVGVGPGGLLNILHEDDRFNPVTGIDIRHYTKLVKLHETQAVQRASVLARYFCHGKCRNTCKNTSRAYENARYTVFCSLHRNVRALAPTQLHSTYSVCTSVLAYIAPHLIADAELG